MFSDENGELLDERQLAARWGCSVQKLQLDRYQSRGAPFLKLGRHVRYRVADVEAYEAENMRGVARKRGAETSIKAIETLREIVQSQATSERDRARAQRLLTTYEQRLLAEYERREAEQHTSKRGQS